jgi:pyruvate kinase
VLALSDNEQDMAKLMLTFGCYPMVAPTFKTVEEIMEVVRETILKTDEAKKGDKVVIVGGMPLGTAADTNMILVETL